MDDIIAAFYVHSKMTKIYRPSTTFSSKTVYDCQESSEGCLRPEHRILCLEESTKPKPPPRNKKKNVKKPEPFFFCGVHKIVYRIGSRGGFMGRQLKFKLQQGR
eukprot:GHVH01001719.1.p1 GENE.GHVH01001719.1~~GHVH01001719.1.p1  ORF type:complete len:104 (+),score=12.97 GHVH01001719.1:182-493(+)